MAEQQQPATPSLLPWRRARLQERGASDPLLIASGLGLAYDLRLARHSKKLGRQLGHVAWGGARHNERHWALREINLTLHSGERLGVIGGNGAGKTSLLSVLTGLLDPTEGSVEQWGRVEAMIGLGTGLEKNLTGRENAELGARLAGLAGTLADDYATETIEFAELGTMVNAPISTYSSGMRARLGFALATGRTPDLLFVDEVLSTGDARFRERADARIDRLFKHTGAIVLVTHNLAEVEKRCTRALILERGRIVFDGDPSEAVARYRAGNAE